MANHLRKEAPSSNVGRTPPRQPDYFDEVTLDQIEKITKFLDPDGSKAKSRKVLHAAAW